MAQHPNTFDVGCSPRFWLSLAFDLTNAWKNISVWMLDAIILKK
jgi:hypothetical protein